MTIRGAGGKGGKGSIARTPVEASDTLVSTARVKVLELISEGEIVGLVEWYRSVYLDGTVVENPDASRNFTGVDVKQVTGTQGQSYIEGYSGIERETGVGVEVVNATPITRTVTNIDVDAVRIRVSIPSLSFTNTLTGDKTGSSVGLSISVQSNGGGFVLISIGKVYVATATPMFGTSLATGVKIEVEWSLGVLFAQATLKISVEYRVVGAGSWTVLQTDSFQSGVVFQIRGELYPSRAFTITKTYVQEGLAAALYEVRVVQTSGTGASLKTFWALIPDYQDIITGKCTNTYQRSYRVELPKGSGVGHGPPWDIRVTRNTPDSVQSNLQNKTYFESITEIVDEKFSYPNSALVALSVDAKQFQTIPTRGYDVKLLKVQIPSNYDPVTRVYTGTWDGLFVVAWTDNPAWCFYDLLTNTRYGLGNYLPAAQVDKFGLYTISQYCDELVPNGQDSTEPRFTCNIYIQTQEEAFKVISDMASIFRGLAYWSAGVITASQDAPADPVFLFTEANVLDGMFSYSGSSKASRHTAALVTWNDPADGYKAVPEYIEDVDAISRYGLNVAEVVAVGCTSQGQAHRVGEWLLYSERYETEVVKFTCGQDGVYLRPGNIFAVQDQHRTGLRYGGRVVSSTVSSVTIDAAITIVSSVVYTIQVVLPDGSLITKTLANGAGSFTVLTISVNFVTQPQVGASWIVTSPSLSPRSFRALVITEIEPHQYEVTGLEHNESKFAHIDRNIPLRFSQLSTLSTVPATPANVALSESLAIYAGIVTVVVTVTWDAVPTATAYRVKYRRDSGNYVSLTDVRAASADILTALPGLYEVRVIAVNSLLVESLAATASRQIYGKTAAPSNVTGFVVARTSDALNFAWAAVTDLDLSYYELRQGLSWESAVPLGTTINTHLRVTTNIGSTYLIKAVDTTGNASLAAAAIIIGSNTAINVVVTANDATGWAGTKVQTVASASGVTLAGQNGWTDLPLTWSAYTAAWNNLLPANVYFNNGTYETVPIDLSVVMTSRVEIEPVVQQLWASGTWSALTAAWATYTTPWAGVPGIVSVMYEIALSQDGATYAAYQPYQSGHYLARAYKFRLTLSTRDVAYLPLVSSFLVTIDVPDRVVHFEDQATVALGTTLTFSPAFVNVQTVTGTIQSGAIGDTFRVTSKTNSSAIITVYDSAGAAKIGIVDVDVFGYGSI